MGFRDMVRSWISGIGWRLFLWGVQKTEEEYWQEIQRQETECGKRDLSWANLSGANLSRADLRGACLGDADLRGADLCGADLSGVRADDSTIWPYEYE